MLFCPGLVVKHSVTAKRVVLLQLFPHCAVSCRLESRVSSA